MGFFDKLKERVLHARIARFAAPEKRALVRLAWGFAAADGEVSDEELAAATALGVEFGVDLNDATRLGLPEAIAILQAKPAHLELSLLLCLDVLFVDGDYDKGERDFIDSLATKLGVPNEKLLEAAQRRAQHTADLALEQWHHDIVSGKLDSGETSELE